MREDMQYISGVMDELEAIVQDASSVPMRRGLAVVDRSDLLVMLDELRGSLPGELSEAEAVRRECAAMVAEAEEDARLIVEEAHRRTEDRVDESEVHRRALRRADEVTERAEQYAEEVSSGSEVYRDRVMGQLENWFEDSLLSVGESRQELGGVPVRPVVRTAERQPTQQQPEPAEDDNRGWRVSSA